VKNFSVGGVGKESGGGDIQGDGEELKERTMKNIESKPPNAGGHDASKASVNRLVRPVCPRCGCPAQFVRMTARVVCVINEDGSVGRTTSVGKRVGKSVYECGGGHEF